MNEFDRLDEVTRRLRKDCPWDREQTHASLSRHAIEEVYELLEAVDLWSLTDPASEEHLIEELGDVLVQVFVHAAIAAEQNRFDAQEIAKRVADKLIERHPHVYGDATAETSDEVMSSWEANKKKAKGRVSVMDGIPAHLPALLTASKVLRKASHAGIEAEIELSDDIGTRLLTLVDEARLQKIEPELALRDATAKFQKRFQSAECAAANDGVDLAQTDKETALRYWNDASADS